jgi:copper oxidase (laccase) domain-containing protein
MKFPVLLLRAGSISCWSVGRDLEGMPFDALRREDVERLSSGLGAGPVPREARQVHGTAIDEDGTSEACDAFLLGPGGAALVRHADCFPVVVADPVRSLAALAHCGWRGTLAGLAGKCARRLVREGSRPGNLAAAIGAGIGQASFEVGPEVLKDFPEEFRCRTAWGTPSIDLVAFLRHDLASNGVAAIDSLAPDTFSDPCWHSWRRDGSHSGRNATICIVGATPSQPGESS